MKKAFLIYLLLLTAPCVYGQDFIFDPNNSIIGYTPRAFTFQNKEKLLVSGEMQYYRIDPQEWKDRMLKMKGALVNCVSTYIPWGLHEPQKGVFDYQGAYDVFKFNRIADSIGMYSILKPSGYVCNEFNGGGFPAWLWAENNWPRTSDPAFLGFLDGWLENIIPQLNPHQITEGGNMIFCQLENEYGKGNKPYLLHYRNKARQLGLNIPLVNNGGGDLGHHGTIATYDLYLKPMPESILKRNWDRSTTRAGNGKPRFSSEYESGWLNAEYSNMVTQMGNIPGEWLKTIASLAYYKGDAGLNYYMFCGGTDMAMNASKKFPNSYFNVAPIGEYGQLNESYYRYKELHAFVRSFEDVFLHGTGAEVSLPETPPGIMVKELSYQDTKLYLVVNVSTEAKSFILNTPAKGAKPHRLTVPALGTKTLAYNFSVGNDIEVVNTSSEILLRKDSKLLLFGESFSEGFIRIKGDQRDRLKGNASPMDITYENNRTEIRYMHRPGDQYFQIGDNQVWIVSKERAENTFFDTDQEEIKGCLVSDLYFGHVASSGSDLSIDYLANTGEISQQTYIPIDGSGFRQFTIHSEEDKEILRFPVDNVTKRPLSFSKIKQGNEFKEVTWGTPYEKAGLYKNGYAFYSGSFDSQVDSLTLLVPEINDYFAIYCNGKLAKKGQRTGEVQLRHLKRKGNLLEVFVLSGGLDKNGPGATMSLSGINMPLYINPAHTIKMQQWQRKKLFKNSAEKGKFYYDKDVLLAYRDPDYSARIGMDIMKLCEVEEGWTGVDFSNQELLQKFDGNVDWSMMSEMIDKTSVYVDKSLKGKKVLLRINDADVWYSLYVNGQHFQGGWQGWDRWGFEDRPRYVDVTSAIRFNAENSIVVRCWQGPKGGGLQESADLVFCDDILDSDARLYDVNQAIETTLQDGGFTDEPIDEAMPTILSGRFTNKSYPQLQAPLYLEVSGSREVTCIFLNGKLIAKHYPYGYSDKIRLLPSLLKEGENTISMVGFFKEGELPDLVVKSELVKEKGKHTLSLP